MLLEKEFKIVNGVKVPKKQKDYTIDELRKKLSDYYHSMNRQHGRKPKVTVEEAVYQDEKREKARLWNNYRSIVSRHSKRSLEKWHEDLNKR